MRIGINLGTEGAAQQPGNRLVEDLSGQVPQCHVDAAVDVDVMGGLGMRIEHVMEVDPYGQRVPADQTGPPAGGAFERGDRRTGLRAALGRAVPDQAGIGFNLDEGPGISPALVVQPYGFDGGDLHLALSGSREGLVVSQRCADRHRQRGRQKVASRKHHACCPSLQTARSCQILSHRR